MRSPLVLLTLTLLIGLSQVVMAQEDSGSASQTGLQSSGPPLETELQPQQSPEQTEDFWMRQKLEYSKGILHSLTAGEFKTLAAEAEKMQRLAKIEGFVRRRNKPYRQQLEAFNLANDALIRSAQDSDVKGSLKAFHKLTSSCVACHQLLRANAD